MAKGKMKKSKSRMVRRKRVKKATVNKSLVNLGKGFPKKILVTHKYVQTIGKSSVSVLTNHVYSCNGLYDPDITTSGHQPMYFDQFGALYNHYCVIGSKIRVKVIPVSSSQSAGYCCISVNDDSTVTPTSIEALQEQSSGKGTVIPASSNNITTMTSSWSARKNWGKNVLSNTLFRGSTSANPTEQQYYIISLGALDNIGPLSFYLEVEIQYIAIWNELKDIAQS